MDLQERKEYLSQLLEKVKESEISLREGVDLHQESLKTNNFMVHWLNVYVVENNNLRKLKRHGHKLYLKLKKYYTGRGTTEDYNKKPLNDKLLRTEVDIWINSDDEWQEFQTLLDVQENIVLTAEKMMDVLKTRAFLIKDALRYLEFIGGK